MKNLDTSERERQAKDIISDPMFGDKVPKTEHRRYQQTDKIDTIELYINVICFVVVITFVQDDLVVRVLKTCSQRKTDKWTEKVGYAYHSDNEEIECQE